MSNYYTVDSRRAIQELMNRYDEYRSKWERKHGTTNPDGFHRWFSVQLVAATHLDTRRGG